MNNSGFYKIEASGNILFAPNYVINAAYERHRDGDRSPVDGWAWCETIEDAAAHLDVSVEVVAEALGDV